MDFSRLWIAFSRGWLTATSPVVGAEVRPRRAAQQHNPADLITGYLCPAELNAKA